MTESQRKAPDREKVIRGLTACIDDMCDYCPYYDEEVPDCDYYGRCNRIEMNRDALALLREQERPGWVSVQDRLPEKYGSYLTLREGQLMPPQTRMAVRFWTGNKDGEYWRGAEAGSRIVGITHWMALPEPPEEVSGDA